MIYDPWGTPLMTHVLQPCPAACGYQHSTVLSHYSTRRPLHGLACTLIL